jgi:hypothetical protein
MCNHIAERTHWPKVLPTRLVVVDDTAVRVCLSENLPRDLQYATLSHCWGSGKYLTLKRDNIGEFCTQIPLVALSKTIREAIDVVRHMGFSYVWIDTLCIIQDDLDDWEHESSLMSTVYEGSGLNIAASGARDGSEGCIFERAEVSKCQVRIRVNEALDDQAEIRDDQETRRYELVSNTFVHRYLSEAPLLRRGWVLQERLLAPRTLHFTTAELFWECHHLNACETFPNGIPQGLILPAKFAKKPLQPSMWSEIIRLYSYCALTYDTDRLVAISGVARHIQQQSRDQYVAGMWRTNLEEQLCWCISKPEPRKMCTVYIAPTWSWASVIGALSRRLQSYKMKRTTLWIAVLDVKLQPAGHDPFGALVGGTLQLKCKALLSAHISPHKNLIKSGQIVFSHGEVVTNCFMYLDTVEYAPVPATHNVTALPVMSGFLEDGVHMVVALLLERDIEQADVYRRVGICWFMKLEAEFDHVVAHAESLKQTDVTIQLV